jgi:hypothetical protein
MFQPDKLKHLAIGLAVACAVYAVTGDLRWTWGAVIVIAAGKEAYDATGRGHVEYRDFVATILPALAPTIWHWRDALAGLGVW